MLNQRVNEWLGNNRFSKYLLSWNEWNLIKGQKEFLNWEPKRDQKQELLQKTRKKFISYACIVGTFLLISIAICGFYKSTVGKFIFIKNDFEKSVANNNSHMGYAKAALTYYVIGEDEKASKIIDKISK